MTRLNFLIRLHRRAATAVTAFGWWGVAVNRAYVHAPWLPRTFELWQWCSNGKLPPQSGRAGPIAPQLLRDAGEELRKSKPQLDALLADRGVGAKTRIALAALEGGHLLGATWLTQRADGSWLSHDTFVVAGARRVGVGEALIQAAQREVLTRTAQGPASKVWGEVLPHNRGSRAMLTACGWMQVGMVIRWRGRVVHVAPAGVDYVRSQSR